MNVNVILSEVSKLAHSKGLKFERLTRDRIGADYGFEIRNQNVQTIGTVFNTTMTGQIYQEIKSKYHAACESNPDRSFVILNDLVDQHFAVIPYSLLKPSLYLKTVGIKKFWQFALKREKTGRATGYYLLKFGGGIIRIPNDHIDDLKRLFQPQVSEPIPTSTASVPVEVQMLRSVDYESPPQTFRIDTLRFIRDTAKARQLKQRYSDACQVCGIVLKLNTMQSYSEVHHLRPLSEGGLDNEENMHGYGLSEEITMQNGYEKW